jgi:hypothetical protein
MSGVLLPGVRPGVKGGETGAMTPISPGVEGALPPAMQKADPLLRHLARVPAPGEGAASPERPVPALALGQHASPASACWTSRGRTGPSPGMKKAEGFRSSWAPRPSWEISHTSVRKGGFEPPRPFGHWHLKPARLPFRHLRVTARVSRPSVPDAPGIRQNGPLQPLSHHGCRAASGAPRAAPAPGSSAPGRRNPPPRRSAPDRPPRPPVPRPPRRGSPR